MSQDQQEAHLKERRISVNYEVPLTYLIGCVLSMVTALVYAGASANAMSRKLDDAVEMGKTVLKKNEETNTKVVDLSIQQKLTDARLFQVENRLDRSEQRK
jgi:hypothetical protein